MLLQHLDKQPAMQDIALQSGLLIVCLLPFAVSGAAAEPLPPDLKKGQEIYKKYCVECHGEQGRGDGPRASTLAPRPGNLISAGTSAKTDRELLRTITNGVARTAMRGWKDQLTEEDRLNVLAFIRSLVHFQEPSLTPPPPDQSAH